MPYTLPRSRELQDAYRQLRPAYSPTRSLASERPDPLAELKELAELHRAGRLTDDEFSAAKAKVLGLDD
jgi:hypothetical protein